MNYSCALLKNCALPEPFRLKPSTQDAADPISATGQAPLFTDAAEVIGAAVSLPVVLPFVGTLLPALRVPALRVPALLAILPALWVLLLSAPVRAEGPTSAPYSRTLSKEFAAAADRIMPSVVSIIPANSAVPTVAPQPSPSATPEAQPPAGQGSGVVIDSKGHILTNAHVVGDAGSVRIVFHDDQSFPGKVVHRDVANDLALVTVSGRGSGLPAPIADGEALRVGDWVLAAGNPFGLGFSISAGIVSATHRVLPGMGKDRWFVQTDAAINPGNSGGPLIDLDGRVVGISTAIYSRTGNFAGVGFVIPAERVTEFLKKALPDTTPGALGGGGSKLPQVQIGE